MSEVTTATATPTATSTTDHTGNKSVTNQITDSTGKASVDATGGALTFDELEELTMKAKTKKAKDLTSDSDKGKGVKDEKSESKAGENKESKGKENKEGAKDQEGKAADQSEQEKPKKTIRAKSGEQEIELDEEALIPVSVNGKTEYWTLKELRADKSGKTAWDKKFTEIDKVDKEVKAKLQKAESINKLISEIVSEQDEDMRLYKIAQLSGHDPVQFRKKFFEDNIKVLEKYYAMNDDERRSYDLEFESKVHKMRADTLEGSIKEQEAVKQIKSKVDSIRASHNIQETEFFDQYDKLLIEAQNGRLNAELITPEFIAKTIIADRLYEPAMATINKLAPNKEDKIQFVNQFVTEAINVGIEPADVPEVLEAILGKSDPKQKIQQKIKENSEFVGSKKEVASHVTPKAEPLFFDQM